MLLGRIIGWMLIALAVVMASADAVLALGPDDHAGIITADVVILLTGDPFTAESIWTKLGRVGASLMSLPAWIVMLALGIATVLASRKRERRFRFRRA